MGDVRRELATVLRDGQRTVERRLDAFLANPDDVETIHRLRISIRTLRSLLAFASPFLKCRRHRLLQADLRSVVIETSRLREYDVMLRDVRALGVPSGELVEKISELRDLERDRVVGVMRGRHTRRALARVRRRVGSLPWKDSVRRRGVTRDDVLAVFDELVRSVDEGYATVDRSDADAVHTLRKRAKRVRYVGESFGALLGARAVAEGARMKGVQDELGDVCDARVNAGMARDLLDLGLSDEARGALEVLLGRNRALVEGFVTESAPATGGKDDPAAGKDDPATGGKGAPAAN